MMGRQDGEADERPVRELEIKPFYIDKFEVTNQQYKRFVDATGRPAPKNWENGSFAPDEARLPVTHVTWQDAADYAKWANKRLPKEEEWEYVARGGKGYLYPWGNQWQDEVANVNRRESQKPAPVHSFEKDQSLFGVYDLAGNVSEWVEDFYSESYGAPPNKNLKVYRGGNFYDRPKTSTFRWSDYPTPPADAEERQKYNSGTLSKVGFRCAKDVGQ
jgi:serine/threonine-protein kinase